MKHTTLKTIFLMTSLSLAMASGVQATEQSKKARQIEIAAGINFNWFPDTATGKITFYTGCRSAAAGYVIKRFSIFVDTENRTLNLDGSFILKGKPRDGKVRQQDCMGSRQEMIDVSNITFGLYTIKHNGKKLWSVELADKLVGLKISPYQMRAIKAVPKKNDP